MLLTGLLGATQSVSAQSKVVVSHDEWYTGPGTMGSNEQQFVLNSLTWMNVLGGSALVYSSNGFLTNSTFLNYLAAQGMTTTVSTSPAPFNNYGVVFVEGNPSYDAVGLGAYVLGGGNVVYIGGTGTGGAPAEAAYSNLFLNQFGLSFQPSYNGIGTVNTVGYDTQGPFGAPLFTGVSSVYGNNGNSITASAPPAGWTNQVFLDAQGNGVFAAAAVTATPEPATLGLFATGVIAMAGAVRRRKQRNAVA
ncbi:MAG: PEP-CTERM sorting domain-containing protein [bacterium]